MNKNGNGNAGLTINKASLQVLSAVSGRTASAATLGKSLVGDRDLYQALGYPLEISLEAYEAKNCPTGRQAAFIHLNAKRTGSFSRSPE
jgi:hypothetical protein